MTIAQQTQTDFGLPDIQTQSQLIPKMLDLKGITSEIKRPGTKICVTPDIATQTVVQKAIFTLHPFLA